MGAAQLKMGEGLRPARLPWVVRVRRGGAGVLQGVSKVENQKRCIRLAGFLHDGVDNGVEMVIHSSDDMVFKVS
jgi:hypothetical protein